jgi:hypothetical protein
MARLNILQLPYLKLDLDEIGKQCDKSFPRVKVKAEALDVPVFNFPVIGRRGLASQCLDAVFLDLLSSNPLSSISFFHYGIWGAGAWKAV